MVSLARKPTRSDIVAVVDSSAESQAALRWALREGARRGCGVVALGVVDPMRRSDWPLERDRDSSLREEQERLADRVSRALVDYRGMISSKPPPVSLCARRGPLGEEVARIARSAGVVALGGPLFQDATAGLRKLPRSVRIVLVDEDEQARCPARAASP